MENFVSIILAAGKGSRMKSKIAKPMHKIFGRPIIEWGYNSITNAGVNKVFVVISKYTESIINALKDKVTYVYQDEQLGTGHALMQVRVHLEKMEGNVLVVCGDIPTLTHDLLVKLMKFHIEQDNSASVLTTVLCNPRGYGRIIRKPDGQLKKIVQHVDATPDEIEINEVDAGVYCFKISDLVKNFDKMQKNNMQSEYYQTDIINEMCNMGLNAKALISENPENIMCVNDRKQYYEVAKSLRYRILDKLMFEGVTVIDPDSTYIDDTVKIGADTVLYPNVTIKGKTIIEENCTIGPNCYICDSELEMDCQVSDTLIMQGKIGTKSKFGSYVVKHIGDYR